MIKERHAYIFLCIIANMLMLAFVAVQALLVKAALAGSGFAADIVVTVIWLVAGWLFLQQLVFVARIYGAPVLPWLFRQAWLLNSALFPLIIRIGAALGCNRDCVMRSFINAANNLYAGMYKIKPEQLLVLLPHCVQNSGCRIRVTADPQACARCGRCKIGELLGMADALGVKVAIATGGTLARKIIREIRPQAVLAVACERDLVSGLKDVFPLPAVGVLNKRPFGPCHNTDIDVAEIAARITSITGVSHKVHS